MGILKRIFDWFLFSSLYIGCCAILMVHQTNHLLGLHYAVIPYFVFVFFSTICSYNFHWYLTPVSSTETIRARWTQQHKRLHLFLCATGLIVSVCYFFYFIHSWFWLGIGVVLTFLYSAPKLPVYPFTLLRKVAVGKTIFLAAVWTYVTGVLPILLGANTWKVSHTLFCTSRFFLIYAICIVFDYRDRESDKLEGIRSMITYFNERGINRLFSGSLLLFALTSGALYYEGFSPLVVLLLLSPGAILLCLFRYSKRHFSDYYYYFVLDGLMMISALFTSVSAIYPSFAA